MSATEPVIPQETHAPGRPLGVGVGVAWRALGRLAVLLLPVLVIGLLAWPLVLAGGQPDGDGWPTHLWFIAHQAGALHHDLWPSLFAGYDEGVFYPHYGFYGGTLYALTGAVALLTGEDGRTAYVLAHLAGFGMSYGGWVWLGRMAGLGWWRAQAPAVLFVTSAYFLTSVYTRGAWPEFMAVSSMPMVVAASISVVRGAALRALPAAALAAATIVFTGSHALTLMYGTLFFMLVLAPVLVAIPHARALVGRAGLLRWTAIVVPAALVNAWFLWPLAAYGADTQIGANVAVSDINLRASAGFAQPGSILTLGRQTVNAGLPEFVLTLPVLAIGWVLVTLAILLARRSSRTPWVTLALILVLVAGGFLIAMTNVGIILALPSTLHALQFSYRLEAYILACVAGALLCALVGFSPGHRRHGVWLGALVVILALTTLGAARQVEHRLRGDRSFPYASFTFAVSPDYVNGKLLAVVPSSLPVVTFPYNRSQDESVTVTVDAEPRQLVATNLLSMRQMIHIEGASAIALQIDRARVRGVLPHMVLQIDDDATPGAAKITVSRARSLPIAGGKIASITGMFGLLAVFAGIAIRSRRRDLPTAPTAR